MNEIKFLLKFGKREHLERLQTGKMYFSNARSFRQIEENLLIKGQGDRMEGGSYISASNMTMVDRETDEPMFTGIRGNMLLHYEPADLLPVFCIFCCFEKDCVLNDDGTLSIKLPAEIKDSIISHFPNADTVAVIKNPHQFIEDVTASIGYDCKSDLVNYFHLTGFDGEHGKVNDLSYFKYLMQDTPPVKMDGKTVYSFNAKYVYRALLCKDVFFANEQEYRFILPDINIVDGREFPVTLRETMELHDLSNFFAC